MSLLLPLLLVSVIGPLMGAGAESRPGFRN